MIDAREQIKDLLLTVCSNVKMSKPDGDVTLPLICYAETSNLSVNVAYDRIRWRVAVYCNTFAELVELVNKVDAAMAGLGFTRTYITPDDEARKGTDLYLKRLDYSALINKEYNTVVRGSV